MNGERLGRRIVELRKQRGISSPELARRARIDRSDMWRIEAGRGPKSIGLDRLERIAAALDVTVSDLLLTVRKARTTRTPRKAR
jgi:transcriptional regulator with XRE-family HTH domain